MFWRLADATPSPVPTSNLSDVLVTPGPEGFATIAIIMVVGWVGCPSGSGSRLRRSGVG